MLRKAMHQVRVPLATCRARRRAKQAPLGHAGAAQAVQEPAQCSQGVATRARRPARRADQAEVIETERTSIMLSLAIAAILLQTRSLPVCRSVEGGQVRMSMY